MSFVKKLASQTALYGLTNVSRLINFLILAKLHSTVLSQAESGVQGNFYAYISFFNILFTYGLETAFFRFANKTQDPKAVFGTAYISLMSSSVLLIFLGWSIWPTLASFTGFASQPKYLLYLGAILLVDTLSAIPYAGLRQQNRPIKFAVIKIAGMLVFLLLNLFFLWFCPSVSEGKICSFAQGWINSFYIPQNNLEYIFLANLISSLFSFILLGPQIFGFKYGFDKQLWKQMMQFAGPLLLVGLLGMTNETLDRILIPKLIDGQEGLIQNGIYSQCYKISIFLTVFVQAFRYAAEPFFFSKANDSNAPKIYALVMDWFVLVCVVVITILLLYIDIAKHLLDEKFWEGIKIVPILLFANLFMGINTNLSIWYKVTDKTSWGILIAFCGAFLTVLLNIIWIPQMGYLGAAWATLWSYLGMATLSYFIGQKHYKVPYNISRFFILLFSTVALVAISDLLIYHLDLIGFWPKTTLNTGLLILYLFLVWKLYINKLRIESRVFSGS
ncbi:MAG: polysaccharide biosynthesis C-terminal domain-containing protein [Bacteroidota bacterium]|nr:polysaccharide biosynthesis C-terminal domain-containing protein [Bacteroidota bacterium]